ncbi:heat stress transcription factor A-5 [Phalaenopsis equestris]|uniref:heat stress transcription factor A-5 n=1 Tax=Phalaenopsis equestris TaxID=78828 RepID=UPI0009E62AE7|nr:heat stress transcription factor A-5 [Phalaenopsis equestris]
MEPTTSTVDAVAGGSSAGAGGPAPFLVKTYDMVDDSSTDDIVSWTATKTSFVVWNPPEFSSRLLPTYFKHNNFSSFIRQLNTYGFRKIDPERWEFANDEFVKGQKHKLKNIHRRKPIHSHSNPPHGSADAERTALEEEIERLQREKAALQANLWRFKQQQSGTKIQLEDIERRLLDMEQRQEKMVSFLQRAVQNPKFVENLVMMGGSSASALHKKRRHPGVECCPEVGDNSFCENSCSNSKPTEVGNVFSQDFCDKLRLELSPAFSESNLVSPSNQGSNEGYRSPQVRPTDDDCPLRMECLQLVPETLELSDTGASFCPRKNSLLSDDGDGLISCHLKLSLSSSSMHMDSSTNLSRIPSLVDLGVTNGYTGDDSTRISGQNKNADQVLTDTEAPTFREVSQAGKPASLPANVRVNDKFWEQFLTERPGYSDTEEASSSLRDDPCEDPQEERMAERENNLRSIKDMEQLTL